MEPQKLFYNQRHMRVIKLPADQYHAPYSFFNIEARKVARISLTGGAFKLYDYFTTYASSYHEYISKKRIMEQTGLSRCSYINAFKELQEHGYIQHDPKAEDPDYFVFIENAMLLSSDG